MKNDGGSPKKAVFNVIGKPRRRVDARAKVTGRTVFADDLVLPRMVHMKLLRSHLPHARIKKIDVSAAKKMPGVKLVLTDAPVRVQYVVSLAFVLIVMALAESLII